MRLSTFLPNEKYLNFSTLKLFSDMLGGTPYCIVNVSDIVPSIESEISPDSAVLSKCFTQFYTLWTDIIVLTVYQIIWSEITYLDIEVHGYHISCALVEIINNLKLKSSRVFIVLEVSVCFFHLF